MLPLGLIMLYGEDITGIVRASSLVRADCPSSNVTITGPRDRMLLDDSAPCRSGFPIVPVEQEVADLLTLSRGRLAEEAEQFTEALAVNDGSGRE